MTCLVPTMDCLGRSTWEQRQMKYLLGSLKKVPPQEQRLYDLSCEYIYKKHDRKHRQEVSDKCSSSACNTGLACQDVSLDVSDITTSSSATEQPGKLFVLEASKQASVPQTVNMWRATMDIGFNLSKMKKRKVMYILPLEEFPPFIYEFTFQGEKGFFVFLQKFAQAFFRGYDVRLMPGMNIHEAGWKVTSRIHKKTGQSQLLVKDLYKYLKKRIPKDAYCILGITWTDLYPSDEWNFVLGEATSAHRSGVFSFGRFEPKLYKDDFVPPPIESIDAKLIWRMMKAMSHETCHIYGMDHCVFFQCLMNESSSLEEALHQPVDLCPVCLRKLQVVCGFNMLERYQGLLHFLQAVAKEFPCQHIHKACDWLTRTIAFISEDESSQL